MKITLLDEKQKETLTKSSKSTEMSTIDTKPFTPAETEIEDDFENYAHNTDYCRKVLDKWVFVMA